MTLTATSETRLARAPFIVDKALSATFRSHPRYTVPGDGVQRPSPSPPERMAALEHRQFPQRGILVMTIKSLGPQHLEDIDSLMKRNSGTLGFLPGEALLHYLEKDSVLGKITDSGEIAGYLLYAEYENRFRIIQLCVAESFRGKGVAKELVDALVEKAATQKFITLRCRRDFPAHEMWPRLRFVPLGEKRGRSRAGHTLVQWHRTLAPDDQLSLFQEKTSSDALNVVIDAHILYSLNESSDEAAPSRALYENYSEDSFFLQITEETYNEIDRGRDAKRRQASRNIAENAFPKVEHDRKLVGDFEKSLKDVLPGRTLSDKSDIRQLAITASSETEIFVTEDSSILEKANDIARLTGLQILRPTELILQYETRENRSYRQNRVIGSDLSWEKISTLSEFPYERFLEHRERKGKLRGKLESFLSNSRQFECDLLRSCGDILAIRVIENNSHGCIVRLSRVARRDNREFLESFLVADTVRNAVKRGIGVVTIRKDSLSPGFVRACRRIGFQEHGDELIRFCLTRSMSRDKILSTIRKKCPAIVDVYSAMSDRELEKSCSPVDLVAGSESYFLIPIKRGYAMSLVDRAGPGDDLFGGESRTLLQWDNVYYRSNTHHRMLKPPSRILWYVSAPRKEVIAISHLDHVETGPPGELFKKYKKFGILDWPEIYRICKKDTSQKIMALQFSHTFPLRQTIPLNTLRKMYREDNVGLSLRSVSTIPASTFGKLYRLGFRNK